MPPSDAHAHTCTNGAGNDCALLLLIHQGSSAMAYTSKDLPAMRASFETLRPVIEEKVAKKQALNNPRAKPQKKGSIHRYFKRRV